MFLNHKDEFAELSLRGNGTANKDIIKIDLGAEELKELSMEDLGNVARGGAWHDVHAYIDEMNRKYGGNAREEDFSPEERRHLKRLRDKGYAEWRNRLR